MTTSKTCTRFEDEGLLQLERGLPLDEHFTTCRDCAAAWRAHERLKTSLRDSAAEHCPPRGWQAAVWARIAARRAESRTAWSKARLWLPIAAALVVVVAWMLLQAPLRQSPEMHLEVIVEAVDQTVRGLEARPGDRLLLRATIADEPHAELRVYREESELILRCSSSLPCIRRDDGLEAILVLPYRGVYQSLLLVSQSPLPEPGGGFDQDAGAALRSGARIEAGTEITVR